MLYTRTDVGSMRLIDELPEISLYSTYTKEISMRRGVRWSRGVIRGGHTLGLGIVVLGVEFEINDVPVYERYARRTSLKCTRKQKRLVSGLHDVRAGQDGSQAMVRGKE